MTPCDCMSQAVEEHDTSMSMSARVVVIGGGEHARVVIDALRTTSLVLAGYSAPTESVELRDRFGAKHLGDDKACLRWARQHDAEFVLGVGAVSVSDRRKSALSPFLAAGVRFAAIIHSAAWVSPSAYIAPGVVVMAGAMINTGARIGAHAVINTGAIVEHDCIVGEYAMVGPAATFGGGATIGEGSYVGLGARIRDHVHVGSRVMVAMGTVVTRDVPDGVTAMGVPARWRSP